MSHAIHKIVSIKRCQSYFISRRSPHLGISEDSESCASAHRCLHYAYARLIARVTFQLISRHSRFGRLPISPDSSILKSNIKTIKGGWWSTWIRPKWELSSRNSGWLLEWRSNSWPNSYILRTRQSHVGKPEFPIVKDTTPNMMNPRLYTTSYNKPQGQQFDDTAVLSFIKLQYT